MTSIDLKQLEEANILVIHNCDLLDAAQTAKLQNALKQKFPKAEVFVVSARTGAGLAAWFERCLSGELRATGIMDVDYHTYGVGEAMLGWLNALVQVEATAPLDGNKLLQQVAEALRAKLAAVPVEVAHLKMTLSPVGDSFDIAVINLVRTDAAPEMLFPLADSITDGELTVNLRAEAAPAVLEKALRNAAAEISRAGGVKLTVTTLASFKPGQPNPTHRIDAAGMEHRPVLPVTTP